MVINSLSMRIRKSSGSSVKECILENFMTSNVQMAAMMLRFFFPFFLCPFQDARLGLMAAKTGAVSAGIINSGCVICPHT